MPQAANAVRPSATPCPSAAACTTMAGVRESQVTAGVHPVDPGELQPQPPAGGVVIVQQHVVPEIPPAAAAGALEQRRAAHRHQRLPEQAVDPQAAIMSAPHAASRAEPERTERERSRLESGKILTI